MTAKKKQCGAVWTHAVVCDRERGHDGDHRGYADVFDEVLFWPKAEMVHDERCEAEQPVLPVTGCTACGCDERRMVDAGATKVEGSQEESAQSLSSSSSSVDATARLIEADLHQQIMNIPSKPKGYGLRPEEWRRGYGYGHKDARHAAAELVAASIDAVQVPHETRFAWLMERRLTIDSGGMRAVPAGTLVYWDGGHAESFTTDANDAVQWCRRQDVLACTRFTQNYAQWGWQIVEHGFTGEAQVDAVQVRVHQIEQERDEWKAILHSPTGAFGPEFARNLLRAALDQHRETREKLAATEARVSHLEQELKIARDLQSQFVGQDLRENPDTKGSER